MKNNFFVLPLAAIALLSCEKEASNISQIPTSSEAIVFRAAASSGTRAYVEADGSTLKTGGFKVAGVASGAAASFFNETAAWDQASSCYKTANTYYHPSEGNASFYAVYPSDEVISVSSGKATLSYASDVEDDIMSAYAVGTVTDKPVSLQFGHVLSQACIKAKGEESGFVYKVKSVKLTGKGSGVLDIATSGWTSSDGSVVGDYYSGDKDVSTSDYSDFGVDNMAFIPKGDSNGGTGALKVTVGYQVLLGSTVISDFTGDAAKSVDVNLEQGKRCVVNCTLPTGSLNPITFTISVVPWADADAQNVTL